ncbi:OLC1v1017279C1 [Oldenlandia corymbosa var. corymbosa]|uniref:OLC1v1017279C1 n=1 Tax=Oldenlandia corymbosa var. corymbosa TaxID=529605 RepID=A0AAV1E927_OLDCO|nr:OLC1v1017279C1 [Oldenlandia corymbosa var. corymbosa]
MATDNDSPPQPQEVLPKATATTGSETSNKLTLIPLIFLIYFEVAGGPYGEEPVVKAAGPLLGILGFIIFPFIWSIPEALITAELSTAFPGNGGFVIWADQAFGPFWGSLMGTWKFLSGVINIAAFPALFVDYLKNLFPVFSSGVLRYLAILVSTVLLSFLNFTGVAIVGYAAVALGMISLAPFVVMSLIAIPKIRFRRWIDLGQKDVKRDWNLYFNTLFWNLNFWDNVSTMAGEVDNPQKTFPLGLLCAVVFTCFGYIIPLLAAIGAVSVDQRKWEAGFMVDVAEMISGKWLKIWIEIGAFLSGIGLFEAQLSSCAYQFEGMADIGFLPEFCKLRSKWFNTPWVGIVLSTAISLAVSCMSYTSIISTANFLYSLGMLLEFSSFLWLRWKFPALKRPYRVPIRLPGMVIMCLIPSGFLVFIMAIATKTVYLMSGLMTAGGIGWYFFMKVCKSKKWFNFRDCYIEEDS